MMDKFKKLMGVPSDEEDYDYEDEVGLDQDDVDFMSKNDYDAQQPRGRSNKVLNIATTTQLQVVLVKPEEYEEARAIGDHLNKKCTVVLNLESANRETARRLLDFLSGVAYANNGNLKKVANSTYIITPYNVGFTGDIIDELENNGVFI